MATTGAASAAWVNVGNPITIQEINDQGGFHVLDKFFTDFNVSVANSVDAVAPDATEITLQGGYWDGGLSDGEIGFHVTGLWHAAFEELADSTISFNLIADDPMLISDNTLYMDGFYAENGGAVSISENVYHDQPGPGVDAFKDKGVYWFTSTGARKQTHHEEFEEIHWDDNIWVVIDAGAGGGDDDPNGVGHLSSFYVTFSEVIPEPASMLLLTVGAGALALRRRRG
ncbi:MAG: PEP-CTERM sorting domain-containing protein [Phycisphaerae bacterium]